MEMENKIFVNRAFPLGSIPSISRSWMLQTLRQFVADHYVGWWRGIPTCIALQALLNRSLPLKTPGILLTQRLTQHWLEGSQSWSRRSLQTRSGIWQGGWKVTIRTVQRWRSQNRWVMTFWCHSHTHTHTGTTIPQRRTQWKFIWDILYFPLSLSRSASGCKRFLLKINGIVITANSAHSARTKPHCTKPTKPVFFFRRNDF